MHIFLLALLIACGSKPPGVERISPPGGAPGIQLTITGNGFAEGITAELGGRPLSALSVQGERRITATVPDSLAPGEHDLVLTNPDGGQARIPRAFAIGPRAMPDD